MIGKYSEIVALFLEFEYYLQQVKLQFLRFLSSKRINPEILKISNLFKNPEEGKPPLCLGVYFGKGASLFTGSVYVGRPYGTISAENYPYFLLSPEEKTETEELLKKVGEIDNRIKSYIRSEYEKSGDFKNFLNLVSEYFLTKVTVHELIVDLPGFHKDGEDTAFLFPEVLKRYITAAGNGINYGDFRELIVTFLRFGKSPAELICQKGDNKVEMTNAKEILTAVTSYWYYHYLQLPSVNKMLKKVGYQVASLIKKQGENKFLQGFLARYMRWNRYSMCAFDAGPIFLRKKKELMLGRFVESYAHEDFRAWDKFIEKGMNLKDLVTRLLERNYHIVLDYEQFGDWTLSSWLKKKNRKEYFRIIEKAQEELKNIYKPRTLSAIVSRERSNYGTTDERTYKRINIL